MTLTAKNREKPPSREGVKNGCIQLASSPSVVPSNLSILTMIDPILKYCQQPVVAPTDGRGHEKETDEKRGK
jgi:hypothetical protein